MELKRTPDSYFDGLPDFSFSPNYVEINDLRMHFVDEGKGEIVLLLHGEPSWSYLYRKMIPILVKAGFRVIVPDLPGFGRSDKPSAQSNYSYRRHIDWMWAFIEKLNLEDITLFCQDWGGLIGLRLVAAHPARFARVVAANTGLPTGNFKMPDAFMQWREFSQNSPKFDIGRVIQNGTASQLPPEVVQAYNAPFPDDSFQAGARMFPSLVPISMDDPEAAANRAAWQALMQFKKPFLTLFSDGDPITRGGEAFFQKMIPGANGQPHEIIRDAGHFLQEDKGAEIAEKMVLWMKGD